MDVSSWLSTATKQLSDSDIATARLDCLVLLEDILNRDRSWLLANPTEKLTSRQVEVLKILLSRRIDHEPIAYLRGKTEFYGREFIVSHAVLEPRPESEAMVECLIELLKGASKQPIIRLGDIGAGSGALGITAALELPDLQVELIELDDKARKVAKMNVDLFTLNISVIKSDLLEATSNDYDVLLCNLPYVPDDFEVNRAASHEPPVAIFGGPDGLDLYRKLFLQVNKNKNKPLYILTESLPAQRVELSTLASKSGYDLKKTSDFIQVFEFKK
jgi:release factor glutamine methyltransferase